MKSTVLVKALNTQSVSGSVTIEIHCDAWKWGAQSVTMYFNGEADASAAVDARCV